MMQQYLEAKNSHPGMMLLFRMGDFYELFNEDAQEASRILGLTLTSRDKSVPMAGFPHHSLENHLRKLLQAGKRVAVCDQVEEASEAKGLVRRKLPASSRRVPLPKMIFLILEAVIILPVCCKVQRMLFPGWLG